jgi:hypothetical protein
MGGSLYGKGGSYIEPVHKRAATGFLGWPAVRW